MEKNCKDCPAIKKLQGWNRSAWSRGFLSGRDTFGLAAKHAEEALAKEKEARLNDNAYFTEEIMKLEEELEQLRNR